MKFSKIIKKVLLVLALFLTYVLIGIFISYARHPKITEETKKNADIDRFYEPAKSPERAVVVEKNGDALLQRIRLIKNAEKEIVLSTFAFHSDNSGKIVIGALREAADRGVKVKVLTDGFESWVAMEFNPYFHALSSHKNIEVKLYNRANPLKPWTLMGRMHDKYLVADRKTYMLGGRNTYDYFLGDFPGHKNYDRDVFVHCENPTSESSVEELLRYFERVWELNICSDFHEKEKLAEKKSVQEAAQEADKCYKAYFAENEAGICDRDYTKNTFETEKIALISNPIHTGAKEPTAWYEMGEVMKRASERVKIHTPYIICNDAMYNTWKEIAEAVPDFAVMTNSVTNNGNAFGASDYEKHKKEILDTGIDIWEYEGGISYHGKSVLVDDDISMVGSFNMDMRSAYLDTELMLVIRSKEINRQLETNLEEYEKDSRQALTNGEYNNPHNVEPVPMGKTMKRRIFLIGKLLNWARFLF
ncbi:MAG: phospholipase D family protein [Eubacteriales bacterium]|nr:phospholipase D family protein [Eubacteriales bacterium]